MPKSEHQLQQNSFIYLFAANQSVIFDSLSFLSEDGSSFVITPSGASNSLNGPSISTSWTNINNHGDLTTGAGISSLNITAGNNAPVSLATRNIKVTGAIVQFFGIVGCQINNFHGSAVAIPQ